MKLDYSLYFYLSCTKTDLKALILSSNELTVLPGLGSLEQLNTLGDHHQLYPVYSCIFCVCTRYANTIVMLSGKSFQIQERLKMQPGEERTLLNPEGFS